MNARVLLLVIVTACFMAAWDGDQSAMQEALARREIAAQAIARTSQEYEPSDHEHSHRLTGAEAGTSEQTAAIDARPAGFILPGGITAGRFQAVNQAGQAIVLTVSADEQTGTIDQDLYVVDTQQGNRWYLVRIHAD